MRRSGLMTVVFEDTDVARSPHDTQTRLSDAREAAGFVLSWGRSLIRGLRAGFTGEDRPP